MIKSGKGLWRRIELRISLVILLITLSLSISIYLLLHSQYYDLTVNNLKNRAHSIHQYAEEVISERSYLDLNSRDDEQKSLYLTTYRQLDEIRRIANILYLYTAKQDADGNYIYILDGYDRDSPDFRHVGDPIEEEIIAPLDLCLDGEVVLGDRITETEWGTVYVAYFPVHDGNGRVIGAIGMEFDCSNLYGAIKQLQILTVVISIIITVVFSCIAIFVSKKISEPFYKKLAYQDALTGMSNRMAFEEQIKTFEADPKGLRGIIMVVFDLNKLKGINDTLGHHVGDAYIKNSAKLISQTVTPFGEAYRIGGDEFAALVAGHPQQTVRKALDSLYSGKKMVIKEHPFDCAYGMASFDPEQDKTLHDLFIRADQKMYEEKRAEKARRQAEAAGSS